MHHVPLLPTHLPGRKEGGEGRGRRRGRRGGGKEGGRKEGGKKEGGKKEGERGGRRGKREKGGRGDGKEERGRKGWGRGSDINSVAHEGALAPLTANMRKVGSECSLYASRASIVSDLACIVGTKPA